MMMVHLDQANPKYNHSCMTCRACVKVLLYVDEIDASINTQMLKNPHDFLVHLAALENEINPEISTFKKERGDIF